MAPQAEMVRFNIAVLKESLEPIIPKAAMQGLDTEFVQEHHRRVSHALLLLLLLGVPKSFDPLCVNPYLPESDPFPQKTIRLCCSCHHNECVIIMNATNHYS